MSIPLLSFIIPVYNKEDYLDSCIESVILPDPEQNQQIEIILIDDCSSDGSRAVCSKWVNLCPNITCLYLDENVGPGMARNEGLKKAKGKYCFFLDADDTVQTKKLPYVLDILKKQPSCSVVCFGKQLCSLGDFGEKTSTCMQRAEEVLRKAPDILLTSLWNYIFYLDFLKQESITFSDLRVCEDYSVVSKALLVADSYFLINDTFYNYNKYVPEGTAMTSHYRTRYHGGQVYLKQLAEYESMLESDIKKEAVHQARRAIGFLIFCTPIPLEHSRETDVLFQRQKKLANIIEVHHGRKHRKIFLCPVCDISLEIYEILKIHEIDVEGFADNRLEHNENVRKIVEKGHLVKLVRQLDREKDFVCICHRNYLTDILSKQLVGMGMKKEENFCCIQEYM